MSHLFVDISSHGFGHLAQTAPVLNALHLRCPNLQLTIRSGLPQERLAQRIKPLFRHIEEASDFGFAMLDALRIDHLATRARYRELLADWDRRVAADAALLEDMEVDFVLSNVSYLPLAGAQMAGVASAAMCSLNWAELFAHFYLREGDEEAKLINSRISVAYAASDFLSLTPAMPMPSLVNAVTMPPVVDPVLSRRSELQRKLGHPERMVLVGFGGIPTALPFAPGERLRDVRYLVPAAWADAAHLPHCVAQESLGLSFSDLLASVDAVITKPGYGTFVEAGAAGTPVLYLRRDDWPEQEALIDWLGAHGVMCEIPESALHDGSLGHALVDLWQRPFQPRPDTNGASVVADWLAQRLRT